ncbi:DUF7344 domain-containing protein [Halomarina rubra]|uniref:DUF7344 domain-containing protein n=1 Tax=Halomarina rubra TaxID=2071873 RepID=A0ABD6ASH6_9EURY|nr:hypothetical protein [Halomarina rubra]
MSSQRLTETPSETAPEPTSSVAVERDDAFHLLSNSRRREVMRYLLDNDGPTELGELAEFVAAKENGCEPDELSSDGRKRVYISLYQGHMPKLAKHDIVEYDQARGTVTANPLIEAFAPYLDETPLSTDDTSGANRGNSGSGFTTTLSSIFGR